MGVRSDGRPNIRLDIRPEVRASGSSIRERLKTFLGAEPGRFIMGLSDGDIEAITELRLRVDMPMIVRLGRVDYVLTERGKSACTSSIPYKPSAAAIAETIERISQYSFYAFEAELSHGYITLPGGHRVGVCGQAVVENGVVRGWRHISSINFRIAHAVKGCGDGVLPYIFEEVQDCAKVTTKAALIGYANGYARGLYNTMIISPPGAGKTTLLRDIVRQISEMGQTVGLVDERSEVAGCYLGVAQNDVGMRTDVLDGCPKAVGMVMLLRAMAPDVIAVDELGGKDDAEAVEAVLTAGVRLVCTAHGYSLDDVRKNPYMAGLTNRKVFERYVILRAPGLTPAILDGEGKSLV